jgi:hypothetical protein
VVTGRTDQRNPAGGRRRYGRRSLTSKRSLGPTRPDRLTIWPVETGRFGVDVEWRGAAGNRRATVAHGMLDEAGIEHRLRQSVDGQSWTLRVGPIPGDEVMRLIDDFLW